MSIFVFKWKSLALAYQKNQLSVEKSVLRAHLKAVPKFLNPEESAQVTLQVYMKLSERNDREKVIVNTHNYSVNEHFSQWIEINVRDGVRSFWPPTVEEPDLELSLELSIDCTLERRVPVRFTNPATISLDKPKRKKNLPLQPFLVLHLSDEIVKDIVRKESENISDDGSLEMGEFQDGDHTNATRRKRFVSRSDCHLEDFEIKFAKVEIDYIRSPLTYNARQCKGSCSHNFLSTNGHFGNNHAKLMAGARKRFKMPEHSLNITEPKGPCCVPSKYGALTVIEFWEDGSWKYTVYPSMVVEACACR